MEIHNSQLDEIDVMKGKLIFVPPKKRSEMAMRLDWVTPVQESLAVVNKQFLLYRPQMKTAYIGTIDKPKNSGMVSEALTFFNASQDKLKAEYDVKNLGLEEVGGSIKTVHLEFTPKVKKQYKTVELWADYNGMPILIKVKQRNNDTMTILLSNIVKNAEVNPNVFNLILPKDTKIIK